MNAPNGAGKPDLRVFEHALAQLQVRPEEAWMVGDRPELDIAPAQQLGIRAIWLDHAGSGLPASSPTQLDQTVRALADLVADLTGCDDGTPGEPAVLPAVRTRYGRSWSIRVSRSRINPPDIPGTHMASPEDLSRFVCGVCGSDRIQYVTSGGTGSVAGGINWYEFVCKECQCHTEYEHEWG